MESDDFNELFEESKTKTLWEGASEKAKENEGPVTVLGKTFESDDARRAYFTNELKEKLPGLKNQDGYPKGKDEDILSLSDAPFYTACPNPWLADFVKEWEKARPKTSEGDKSPTIKPYASDVSVGKNNPIYNAHSYHTKVPHPAIMRYILHYTKPGDIVFDGFAGTGMTGVAASMCEKPDDELKDKIEKESKALGYEAPTWGARHALLADLSPIASFIAYNYNTPCSAADFSNRAKEVLSEVEKECGWMYETLGEDGKKGKINYTVWSDVFICSSCGGDIVFWDAAVDRVKGEVKKEFYCPTCNALHTKKSVTRKMQTVMDKALGKPITQAVTVPVLISYTDSNGKRKEKTPDKADLALIEKINDSDIPYWFPKDEFQKGDKTREFLNKNVNYVHQMYTKRNLWVAAALNNKMDNKTKLLMTSIMSNISKMYRFRINRKGGIHTGVLYIPSLSQEISLFYSFQDKMDVFEETYSILQNSSANPLSTQSATRIMLPANCVDYIFTDPPFGANIMYSELNFINESWLKVKTNNKDEAIENDTQEKGLFEYLALMQRCFSEFYRILKSGKWMTVEFSNTQSSVWNGIQNAINKAGFVIANVASLDKHQGSFNAVTTSVAVKQDLVLSCYKPKESIGGRGAYVEGKGVSPWDFIEEYLERLPYPAFNSDKGKVILVNERTPKVLYDRLITFCIMHNAAVPLDAGEFQDELASRYIEEDGMIFSQTQIASYLDIKKAHNEAKVELFVSLIESERDAIQWVHERLSEKPQKYQDLQTGYRASYAIVKKGDEVIELADVLEENFIENADKTWRIPDKNEKRDREILKEKVLEKKWKEYYSKLERGEVRRLKNVRLEVIRYGFGACYKAKDFKAIKLVAEHINESLLQEDSTLLNYYDIAKGKIDKA